MKNVTSIKIAGPRRSGKRLLGIVHRWSYVALTGYEPGLGMAATTIKEQIIGNLPLAHSVQMLLLENGLYQVVGRLIPDRDPASTLVPEPLRIMEDYKLKSEAEFQYHQVESLMIKVGPPK